MRHTARKTALVLALTTGAALPAAAEPPVCMPTAEMEAALTEWHGERFMARHSSGGRIWAAGYGGTWTLISYREDGLSCTLAHGKDWRPDLDRAEVLEDHAGVLGDGDTALAELSQ